MQESWDCQGLSSLRRDRRCTALPVSAQGRQERHRARASGDTDVRAALSRGLHRNPHAHARRQSRTARREKQDAGQRSGRTGVEALGGHSRGLQWSSVDSGQSLRTDLREPARGLSDAGGILKETDWRKAGPRGVPGMRLPPHARSSLQALGSCCGFKQ